MYLFYSVCISLFFSMYLISSSMPLCYSMFKKCRARLTICAVISCHFVYTWRRRSIPCTDRIKVRSVHFKYLLFFLSYQFLSLFGKAFARFHDIYLLCFFFTLFIRWRVLVLSSIFPFFFHLFLLLSIYTPAYLLSFFSFPPSSYLFSFLLSVLPEFFCHFVYSVTLSLFY